MSRYLTIRQAAARLGVSYNTVRRLTQAGLLDLRRHGVSKGFRIPAESCEEYSRSRMQAVEKPTPSRFQLARERVRSLKTQDPSQFQSKGA